MKNTYSRNRKKLRGWKRRIKQINSWGERIKHPYLERFNQVGDYTYDRCILYPFYTLEKRQPPLWFYKLIIDKFIAAYNSWAQIFNNLGQPYDLQLWLYDPSYTSSEIICYRVEDQGDKNVHFQRSTIQKTFPYQGLANKETYLKQIEWYLADEMTIYFEDDLEYADFTADSLLADGYEKKHGDEIGAYYVKRLGDVWVGRKKQDQSYTNCRLIQTASNT